MSGGERRLAAIMFTDVVGFTTMGQDNEELALQLLEEHRSVVRPLVAGRHGKEVKTIGDAFLVEFGSALDAVRCAVEIQKAMRERNEALPDGRRLQIRIGVHVGDVVHSGGDILGDAVNVSSRIEPLAESGGVCISAQVCDHVRNQLEYPLEKIEGKTLKNVRLPMDVYRIVMPWDSKQEEEQDLDPRRVAVLPLRNMSPDPNDEYFADGMTEELITALSSVRELTVIARTSVMQYKNVNKRIADIGKELKVGTVIEGSVRKAGTKVRITVQLIDSENEGHLWAQNYDKELNDVFSVQSEVAEKVAGALKVRLVESEKRRLERGAETNPEAYNLYLKGMFYWNKRTPESLKKSIELFEQAVKVDSTFALGYAGVALACFITAANHYDDPEKFFPRAKEYAIRALSLDDDLAEAHAVLASLAAGFDRDFERAESEFKRAIELNPSYPSAHQWYGQMLGFENRLKESESEVNRALELSPLSLIINTNVVDGFYYRREYDKGIEYAKKIVDMDPSFEPVQGSLIQLYVVTGRFEEAAAALESYAKLVRPIEAKLGWGYYYAHKGEKDKSRKMMEEVEAGRSAEDVSPYYLALVYFKLGDAVRGFERLEEAYQKHDRSLAAMGVDFELEPYRADPRYSSMLERVGLAALIRR